MQVSLAVHVAKFGVVDQLGLGGEQTRLDGVTAVACDRRDNDKTTRRRRQERMRREGYINV